MATLGVGTPAAADDGELRIDLPLTKAEPAVEAASGDALILNLSPSGNPRYLVTTDAGATWSPLEATGFEHGVVGHVGDGRVVYTIPDADSGDLVHVRTYDFATGATSDPVDVPTDWPEAVGATTVVYVDGQQTYWAKDLAGGEVQSLANTKVTSSANAITEVLLDAGPNALFATFQDNSAGRPDTGYLDVVPLDGSPSPLPGGPLAVAGLAGAAIHGDAVFFVKVSGSKAASFCHRSIGDWTSEYCAPVPLTGYTGDARDLTPSLDFGVDWTLLGLEAWNGYAADLLVGLGGGIPTFTAVQLPKTGLTVRAGDSTRPLVATDAYLAEVKPDGTTAKLFDHPQRPVDVDTLSLAPDRVTGLDDRPSAGLDDLQAFARPVSDTEIGGETRLTPRAADVGTSAARTLLDGSGKLWISERGAAVGTLTRPKYGVNVGALSGPYYIGRTVAYNQVLRVDGKVMRTGQPKYLFGSLALMLTNGSLNRHEVIDLTTGEAIRVTVPAKYRPLNFAYAGIWGDWVLGYTELGGNRVPTTVALNYRTGDAFDRVGYPVAIGDGFAAVYTISSDNLGDRYQLAVWRFGTGESEVVPDDDWRAVSTDGSHRLAYATSTELVVRQLTGTGTSAPRLLGAIAPDTLNVLPFTRSWRLDLDITKAVGPGTLVIRNAAGAAVHTGTAPSTADGSLRGLSWDGRNNGVDVPVGTYTWNLMAPAADGTGNVVGVDGKPDFGAVADATNGVSGVIKVVRTPLGTVTGSVPKVTGTPKTDQTLKVTLGTWSPTAGLKLTYQWYRGTAKISNATGSTYLVSPDDLGAKIRVAVTGTADGWNPYTATSAYTKAVSRASLSPVTTPTISDTTPVVGQTVTAIPGAWGPGVVAFSYQWYKVSSKGKTTTLKGATKAGYVVQAGDSKHRLKVKVTGEKRGYTSVAKTSKVTSYVQA